MKIILPIIVLFAVCGCSTLKTVDMSPEQLRDQISRGEIVKAGDSVRIVTIDGETYKFRVTAITSDQISGKDTTVPIANIVALETRVFSGGKTAALTAGSVVLLYVIAAAAASAALLGGI